MKNFFKENGYQVVKMMLNQVALSMFGGMLVLAGASAKSDLLIAILSILSIVFYMYLLYSMFYDLGQKDGIRINANRLRYDKLKALKIAAVANLINFALGTVTIVFKSLINGLGILQNVEALTEAEQALLGPTWAVNVYSLFNTITRAVQAMYVGVLKVFFPGNPFALLIIPIPAIIIAVVGYRLGVKYCDGFRNKEKSAKERYAEK